ncbi:MAG: c-type cytochrome [Gallionella sp.]
MKSSIVSLAVAGLMVSVSVFATEMPELADKLHCTACHTIDNKLIGPTWQDIANRYKGKAGAAEALLVKISKGGSGNWGKAPMPAIDATGAKQDQIKELVNLILSLAK